MVALVALVATVLASPSAHASHTKEQAPVFLTGHVLRQNDVRVGIGTVAYGVFDFLQAETNLVGYALPLITGDFAPNVAVRVGLSRLDPIFLSFGMGVTYISLSDAHQEALGESLGGSLETELWSMPMIGGVSYHPSDQLLLSTDLAYFVSNNTARAATDTGSGTALLASSSLQGGITGQYALSKVFALTLKGRMVFWTPTIPFEATGEVDGTTVQLQGNVQVASVAGAYQLLAGVALSWKVFNLRLGAGYGNVFVPSLGFVSSYRGFVPDLELYFRF